MTFAAILETLIKIGVVFFVVFTAVAYMSLAERKVSGSRAHQAILFAVAQAAGWGEWAREPTDVWKEAQALAAPLSGIGYDDVGTEGVMITGKGESR